MINLGDMHQNQRSVLQTCNLVRNIIQDKLKKINPKNKNNLKNSEFYKSEINISLDNLNNNIKENIKDPIIITKDNEYINTFKSSIHSNISLKKESTSQTRQNQIENVLKEFKRIKFKNIEGSKMNHLKKVSNLNQVKLSNNFSNIIKKSILNKNNKIKRYDSNNLISTKGVILCNRRKNSDER